MAEEPGKRRLAVARDRAVAAYRSQRVRKTLLIIAIVLVVYGLFGFLAAPYIIRQQIETRASTALSRRVTLGAVHLNPFTLRLQLDQLHIADRDGPAPFVDLDQAVINASWSSLFRMAPVLDELVLQHPRVRVGRSADQRFSFADLIERYASKPADPNQPPSRFSLSNISVHNGDFQFDDDAMKATHHVEQFELGVPFVANLPSDTDVFVQPLLAMRIDGSPMRIEGHTKPFADSRESTMSFQLDRLDLAEYLGYVPAKLPFAIPKGLLSGRLDLRFVQTRPTPQLQLTGNLQLDDLVFDNNRGQPVARLAHGTAAIVDVQPLLSRYHLGALVLDQAQLFYTLDGGGQANLDPLIATPAGKDKDAQPTDLRVASITLTGATAQYVDAAGVKLDVSDIHGGIEGMGTLPGPAARLDLTGRLYGGDIDAKGTLDLAAAKLAGSFGAKRVDIVPLQAIAASAIATRMTKGKVDTDVKLQIDWTKAVNVHVRDARATVDDFALEPQFKGHGPPVAWNKLEAEIAQLDLASRQIQLGTITASGLSLDVQRNENRFISLLDLFTVKEASRKVARGSNPAWHWNIAHLQLASASVAFTDMALGSKPVRIDIQSLKGGMENLSDKLDQPRDFKLEGAVGKGSFTATGKLQPGPLIADIDVGTKQFDIVPFEGYLSVPLNVSINSARLTSSGKLHYDGRTESPKVTYRGNAALERVRVQDKLTGDDFVRWRTLSASNIDADYGGPVPRVHADGLALSSFYARVIVNADGRMNLSDVVGAPEAAPVSVTRVEGGAAPGAKNPQPAAKRKAATPAPVATPEPAATATTAPAADIHVGALTLIDGQLNYTDNFIKPNYTADLTRLTGKVGAFGTAPGDPPADLSVQAALDEDSPVSIDGTINPLQPVAFLDIKGKANEVELTRLTAYSTKYTGYPITAGKMSVDVHYMLDQRKLSADNHIVITQLTFGEEDQSPGVQHLPVKMAVALLEDSEGNVDVNIPVSGSLDDPQFNIGGLVWRAFGGMIAKAITAPFRLLGAAFGGGSHEDLSYVEFDPGSDVLEGPAQDRLGKVVAMLGKKTSLHLDVIGRVDPAKDEDGLRKFTVDMQVRRAKAQDQSGKDVITSNAALAAVTVTPDEYPRYLKRAYKDADFSGKPRNFIGMDKSLEPEEMRSLLETNVATDAAALRDLAVRRASAVQAWLQGKLDDKRYSLKDPKLDAADIDDKGKTTRVDFNLHQG